MNANAYNQKKVMSVTYVCEDYFRIPCNIDLNNKEQVEEHWIKWNVLCIKLKGVEEVVKIQSENCDIDANIDWKNPHTEQIVDADEYWLIGDPDLPFPKVDMKTGEICEDEEEEESDDEEDETSNKIIIPNIENYTRETINGELILTPKTRCPKCNQDITAHDFECDCGWFDETHVWVCEHCGDTINIEIDKCGCPSEKHEDDLEVLYGTIKYKGTCPDFEYAMTAEDKKNWENKVYDNHPDGWQGVACFYTKHAFGMGRDILSYTADYKQRDEDGEFEIGVLIWCP
jgi:hypothetical protein